MRPLNGLRAWRVGVGTAGVTEEENADVLHPVTPQPHPRHPRSVLSGGASVAGEIRRDGWGDLKFTKSGQKI